MAKGTIYNHFASKEEIYFAVVERELVTLMQQIEEAVSKENSSLGKMRAYLITKISRIREVVNFYKATREDVIEYWPLIKGLKQKYAQAERSVLVEILTEGEKRGELVVTEPELTARIIAASTSGMEAPWLLSDLSLSLEEFVDSVVEVFFKGLARKP